MHLSQVILELHSSQLAIQLVLLFWQVIRELGSVKAYSSFEHYFKQENKVGLYLRGEVQLEHFWPSIQVLQLSLHLVHTLSEFT